MVKVRETVQNENHLLCFLKSLNSLEHLDLSCSELSEKFFKRLHTVDSLTKLTLGQDGWKKRQISFDFAQKFRLSSLQIICDLSPESLISLTGNDLARSLATKESHSFDFQLTRKSLSKFIRKTEPPPISRGYCVHLVNGFANQISF